MPIQTLDIEEIMPPKVGFWKRQFQVETTSRQKKFDWFFGVIMPVICVLFDPVVFSGRALGPAYLGAYKPGAFILSFASIMAMAAWLIWGGRLKWMNSVLAGLFLCGGLVSLVVGGLILPLSLIGLMLLFIGALGFIPFFAGFVYLRNSWRAFEQVRPLFEKNVLVGTVVLSALFSIAVPWAINSEIERSIDNVINGSPEAGRSATRRLKYVSLIVNFDRIPAAYLKMRGDKEQLEKLRAIEAAYFEMTGKTLEMDARILVD